MHEPHAGKTSWLERLRRRQELRNAGRHLLECGTSRAARLGGARMVAEALALPRGIELDESLCRRAGIPLDMLDELREAAGEPH